MMPDLEEKCQLIAPIVVLVPFTSSFREDRNPHKSDENQTFSRPMYAIFYIVTTPISGHTASVKPRPDPRIARKLRDVLD